eukprot:gene10293-21482_t
MAQTEEKLAGDQAWSAGNFEKAIEHYSAAINSETTNSNNGNVLKILYSNRSAAHLKLGKNSAALLDADKCVELDPQWAKGLVRKGDALYALSRFTDSYNAYNYSLRIAPNDQSVMDKRNKAQGAIGGIPSSSTSNGRTTNGGWANTAGTSSNSSTSTSTSSTTGMISSIQSYLRVAVLLGTLLYLLPLPIRHLTQNSYRIAAASALCNYLICLYYAHGRPAFNMEYAQKIIPDPTFMYVLLSVLVMLSRPYLMAIAPLALTEFAHLAVHVSQ